MKKRILKNMDWGILICSLILFGIGLVALLSASQSTEYDELKKQIQWFLICIPIFLIMVSIDYEVIAKFSPVYYIITIILLVLVLFTPEKNGATSWFDLKYFKFQPAEFAKVMVILFMAYLMTKLQKRKKSDINHPLKLLALLASLAIPVVLIVKQPDYGTAISFVVAFAFMIFVSGIKKRYIVTAILTIAVLVPVLYLYVLPDHAKKRIEVFLNPSLDPRGSGYNIIQSKLAIGAGQLMGMGIFKGNQTQLGFLYPKTTDFIYSVIGEEFGFLVAGGVVVIYVTLITRALYVAKTAKDDLRLLYRKWNCWYFLFPYDRKYWYDHWIIANYRCTITFH